MEAIARLRTLPISARKVSLLANLIRGKSVATALAVLQSNPKQAAVQLRKLLLSAMANWQNKHQTALLGEVDLFVQKITVNRARMLKRIIPAPRGLMHRIRRRYSHIVIVVDSQTAYQVVQPITAPTTDKDILVK